MKKFAILLTLVTSAFIFAGCSSNKAPAAEMPAADMKAPAHHKDFKGEVGQSK